MTIFQSIIFGLIQGITEFIPISSSAHLALLSYLFNWQIPAEYDFIFKVLLQFATLGAVLIYYAADLWRLIKGFFKALREPTPMKNPDFLISIAIILGTIPLVIIGLPLKDLVAESFRHPLFIAFALLFTALLMGIAEKISFTAKKQERIDFKKSIVIGLFQVLAVFPGISRSGATISAGLLQRVDRSQATRFSFLLSIPALAGAGIISFLDLLNLPHLTAVVPILLPGLFTALIVGLISIHWLVKYVQGHTLAIFSIYCLIISLLTFIKILFS